MDIKIKDKIFRIEFINDYKDLFTKRLKSYNLLSINYFTLGFKCFKSYSFIILGLGILFSILNDYIESD